MKVAFDHDIFSRQEHGGVSRYFAELARRLPQNGCEVAVYAGLHQNRHLCRVAGVAGLYLPPIPFAKHLRWACNYVFSEAMLRQDRRTVLHRTYFPLLPHRRSCPTVITVHDMIHEMFGAGERQDARAKRLACAEADAIIAVSGRTKADLVSVYGVSPAKVRVIYHGVSAIFAGIPAAPLESPYLLFVGRREWYKSFQKLAAAFAASRRLRSDFHLLCFGGGPFRPRELRRLEDLGIRERVLHRHGSDRELAAAYRNARAYVSPSAYEGFGLTLLESMAYGSPVICAASGSMPEIAGDAAQYFTAGSIESLRTEIERVAYGGELRQRLVAAGFERAKMFSWDHCAAQTARLYAAVLPGAPASCQPEGIAP
jgi:glycosyltransferase involved in cell wall biosynthesis